MSVTYRQGDSRWAKAAKHSGKRTIKNVGCGPTSVAILAANSINPNLTPVTTWNWMWDNVGVYDFGTTRDGLIKCVKHFGFQDDFYFVQNSPSKAWKKLNSNCFAILIFYPGRYNGKEWTSVGHAIACTGYKVVNGKHWFYLRDPGPRRQDGWFCYEDKMGYTLAGIHVVTYKENPEALQIVDEPGKGTPPEGGSTDTGTGNYTVTDNGQNLVLTQQISKLQSSDNFTFLVDEVSTTTNSLANAIKQVSYNTSNISAIEGLLSSDYDLFNKKAITADKVFEKAKAQITPKKPKQRIHGKLLSSSSFVESPVIILTLNGIRIGGYGNIGDIYPNYITSMTVNKINDKINQYTINLSYTVRFGENPNFIEKLLSNTGFTNKIQLTYGDSNGNTIFRDDEAVITNVSFNESVSSKTISYTITAVSSIVGASSNISNYASTTAKPSSLIYELFYSNTEQSRALLKALPGMASKTLVTSKGLIPTNDEIITTQSRINISPIAQLMYYVSGMYNKKNNSTYVLSFMDDTNNEFGGAYIKISEISSTTSSTLSGNYFEVDIGYPKDNFVLNFSIDNDLYFPMVYKYNGNFARWNYEIDRNGNIQKDKSNPLLLNNDFNRKNVVQSTWWAKVTEYPITAQLTLKGLAKPIMLSSYIKLNVLFYGASDLASGLYMVTGQTDSISGSGYTTTLSLLRIGKE